MFNSPLHHCKVCNQYVALDQSAEECARGHGCKVEQCPLTALLSPPPPVDEQKTAGKSVPEHD
jgi:hypothetical protein